MGVITDSLREAITATPKSPKWKGRALKSLSPDDYDWFGHPLFSDAFEAGHRKANEETLAGSPDAKSWKQDIIPRVLRFIEYHAIRFPNGRRFRYYTLLSLILNGSIRGDGATIEHLAEVMTTPTPRSVARAVTVLERMGWVHRTPGTRTVWATGYSRRAA